MENIKDFNRKLLGAKIKKIRKEKGFTQEYVAEKLDVTWTYVSGIELGNKTPSLKILIGIAKVLDTNLAVLFSDIFDTTDIYNAKQKSLINIINTLSDKEIDCILNILDTFKN